MFFKTALQTINIIKTTVKVNTVVAKQCLNTKFLDLRYLIIPTIEKTTPKFARQNINIETNIK